MATGNSIGWQSAKSVLECNRYMLDNEIATDVCFRVGLPDGDTTDIRAHKYMLISRSDVFAAMFCGQMAEARSDPDTKIRIEDIDADVFKELLSFIYCENVELSYEMALSLMYAANKYMLPTLAEICGMFLGDCLIDNNVCYVLQQGLFYNDKTLAARCLNFISWNSSDVLNGNGFRMTSRDVIGAILELDDLRSPEFFVYHSCIEWAKYQLMENQSIEDPDDAQIRETLGSLFFKIRFPAMDHKEFAKVAGTSDVLTLSEKSSIYYYLATKDNTDQLSFDVKDRFPELWIDRYNDHTTGQGQWIDQTFQLQRNINFFSPVLRTMPAYDAIDFKTDKDILLTGLGLYAGNQQNGYVIDVEILKTGTSIFAQKGKLVPFAGNSEPHKISLDPPVTIQAGISYSIAVYAYGSTGFYGTSDNDTRWSTKGNVTFQFLSHTIPNISSGTNATRGQIPRLYFK